jgi:hypothetical protein
VLGRGREFAFGQEPDDQQIDRNWSGQRQDVEIIGPDMATGRSQDERRVVAQRIFAALNAHYPNHYIVLIECTVLSAAVTAVEGLDASVRGEATLGPT